MGSLMNRVLMAYRPLYLRGLLMDGQYRLLPSPEPPARGHSFRPDDVLAAMASALVAASSLRPRA